MPVQITINGENANQAIEEFATLSAAFNGQAPVKAAIEEAPPKTRQRKPPATKKEEPVQEGQEVEEESTTTNQDDDVDIPSVVDLRAKAQEVGTNPEKRKAVKALLDKFESPSISDVPEDKRIAFMAELEKLV